MREQPELPLVLFVSPPQSALHPSTAVLAGAGFEVRVAQDAATALAVVCHDAPDLVLIEATLSEVEGSELMQRLRAESASVNLPIVGVGTAPLVHALSAAVDAHLLQPIGVTELGILRTLARLRQAELAAHKRAEVLQAGHRKKDEFMAMLGHELRNPLSALRAGLSLLERSGIDEARAARVRVTMARQTDALVRLVDDLLDVARIEHGKLRLDIVPTDLREVVESSVEAARPDFVHHGVALSTDVRCTSAILGGDPTRLGQVVANLLSNALKFTPAGGSVCVALSVDEREEPRKALLRVRDTGIGIDKEHLADLFQLFFQGALLPNVRGGLGVGLAVVRRLVELHGGRVRVASEGPGSGAEFTIELPLLPVSTQRWTQAASALPVPPGRSNDCERRVLFVDDHADSRELFEEVLQREGHAVVVASDGEEAVSLLLSEAFDVAVVDLGLPELDGYAVARLARERLGARAPLLIAMTGYGGPDEREASARAGFDLHLVKPIPPETLLVVIAKHRKS